MKRYDVVVLGAGPAGLAAGLAAGRNGAETLIIEREDRPGGILKQCIHDGFGLIRFGQRLSGPEYAHKYVQMVKEQGVPIMTSTFVNEVVRDGSGFELTLVNSDRGVFKINAGALVLANGCRERTARQVAIHGTRPAGIYTAGTAQYFVNIMGYLPCKECVILGSGDIGLIMARRLTLEGAKVHGVYEVKPEPSGLSRNIAQCLEDYNIPLYLSHTVVRVLGEDRVEAVEIAQVDNNMNVVEGTEKLVKCDSLILSVGLIPENEIAEALGIKLDGSTKGPVVDQNFMTGMEGVFSCGNALHVNDLVDYVSESGECAGHNAAAYVRHRETVRLIPINAENKDFLYRVPQNINVDSKNRKLIIYFRSRDTRKNARVQVKCGDTVLFNKKYLSLKPPEMERLEIDISGLDLQDKASLEIIMLEG